MTKSNLINNWFNPKKHTGWDKDMPMDERRAKMLHAHKGNKLAAGRAMQALANVTTDQETKQKARADALYFYRQHHVALSNKRRSMPRLSPRFKGLPK